MPSRQGVKMSKTLWERCEDVACRVSRYSPDHPGYTADVSRIQDLVLELLHESSTSVRDAECPEDKSCKCCDRIENALVEFEIGTIAERASENK